MNASPVWYPDAPSMYINVCKSTLHANHISADAQPHILDRSQIVPLLLFFLSARP